MGIIQSAVALVVAIVLVFNAPKAPAQSSTFRPMGFAGASK